MNGTVLLIIGIIWFSISYFVYGKYLSKLFGIDAGKKTPAHTKNDGVDYVPTNWPVLFGHHFASIAGAGPIVGPIFAAYFGWGSVVLWILIGCVFVGAVHDFAALFTSVRDEGRSIGHVIERHIGYSGRQIFLLFSWAALILVVAIFAMFVSKTFVAKPAVATASLLFIAISPIFGFLVYKKILSIAIGSIIFVPLTFFFVWVGVQHPLDLNKLFESNYVESNPKIELNQALSDKITDTIISNTSTLVSNSQDAQKTVTKAQQLVQIFLSQYLKQQFSLEELKEKITLATNQYLAIFIDTNLTQKDIDKAAEVSYQQVIAQSSGASSKAKISWLAVLFIYVFIASILPVWLLLQPRDYLNSYLLYAMMVIGVLGILFATPALNMPAFTGFSALNHKGTMGSLIPLLFVTVACGACSGFHSLVSSGTTAKQISTEKHILRIGYGSMLVEGILAIIALISIAYLPQTAFFDLLKTKGPIVAFASGLASFSESIGLSADLSVAFISLAISAFMLTTLDTATRLTRFTWQELFIPKLDKGENHKPAAAIKVIAHPVTATIIAVGCAGYLATSGNAMAIWPVFGASNQLLAALTLLAVTLFLIKRKANFLITLIPMVFMMLITFWALIQILVINLKVKNYTLIIATAFLIIMALLLIIQAAISVSKAKSNEPN